MPANSPSITPSIREIRRSSPWTSSRRLETSDRRPEMSAPTSARSSAISDRISVRSSAIPDCISVRSPAIPDRISVRSPAIPDRISVRSPAIPDRISVRRSVVSDRISVRMAAISDRTLRHSVSISPPKPTNKAAPTLRIPISSGVTEQVRTCDHTLQARAPIASPSFPITANTTFFTPFPGTHSIAAPLSVSESTRPRDKTNGVSDP